MSTYEAHVNGRVERFEAAHQLVAAGMVIERMAPESPFLLYLLGDGGEPLDEWEFDPSDHIPPRWLSAPQVAKITGYSENWIWSLLRSGKLRGHKPTGDNGQWRVSEREVARFMEDR